MQGSSRQALTAVRAEVSEQPEVASADVGSQLHAVARLIGTESSLRNALTDTGASPQRRAALAEAVFGGKVSDATLEVLQATVKQRWSRPRDLAEALDVLGAESLLAHAEDAGRIDAVEEQLFRFGRVLASSGDLQALLTDPAVDEATKTAVVHDLLAERAEPETVALVEHLVSTSARGDVGERLDELVDLAATRRQRLLADVRVPVALTTAQSERLSAVLTRLYGQPVSLAVTVDDSLLGGAVVRVGDEIIDGSVASRLAAARRTLTQ